MDLFFEKNMAIIDTGRVEGVEKVTGKAKYSAEYDLPNILHAVMVGSTINKGRIVSIQTDEAKAIPGVVDVLTHQNKPFVPGYADEQKRDDIWISFPVFHTDKIHQQDQYIAMVIAETIEEARYAAQFIEVAYDDEEFEVNFQESSKETELKLNRDIRGNMERMEESAHQIDEEYTIAMEVHNPMEMHATIAHWTDNDKLTLYDKNQGVNRVQGLIGKVFEIPKENIHVVSEFVGGGFGSGLRTWPHTVAAAMAAKHTGRPVKLMLTRPQMFTQVGYRPESWQRVKIGADKSGSFIGVHHQSKHGASKFAGFGEGLTGVSRLIYGIENVKTEEAKVRLDLPLPTWMRGPGDASGCFALESAIDELCNQLNLDPVKVRLKNLASYQMDSGKPWSSNFLNECIEKGAEIIGWDNRPSKPGTIRDGDWKIGYGHAIGAWSSGRDKCGASVELHKNGSITVRTAMTDIGTGTGTGLLNVAHMETGIAKNKIFVELGDSDFAASPWQGGSTGMASVSAAVVEACNDLKKKLVSESWNENESEVNLEKVSMNTMGFSYDSNSEISYQDYLENQNTESVKVISFSEPGEERKKYAFLSGAAHFCKVRVHEKTGRVKVDRFVCVADGGTIINDMAAANQVIGSVVWAIGMALQEKQDVDQSTGRLIGADLAGYHFPVNASVPIVEVEFIGKPDPYRNPTGSKGLGEVGLIGSPAAIANAIYNATGKRYRNLPITPEQLVS